MARKFDILHIEQLVESSFEAFCKRFEVETRADKQAVLKAFADVAKAMKGRQ